MKKIDLGHSIATIANLGVIAGIVFLGFELRQNTEAIRVTASQDMASELANFNLHWITTDIAEVSLKVENEGYSSLSALEMSKLNAVDHALLVLHQNLYYQYQNGTLDEEASMGRHRTLVRLFSAENFTQKWARDSELFSDGFRVYIDSAVIPESDAKAR